MGMTNNNLCDSCTNIGCEFQSGIVRTECAFYMRPTIGSIPKEQYENRLKADMVAMLEELKDKILHGHTFDTGAPIEFQHGIDYARRQDLEIIRQKINSLKGEKDGSN